MREGQGKRGRSVGVGTSVSVNAGVLVGVKQEVRAKG